MLDSIELEEAYSLYKELLSPYISQVYGWDESFQTKRFSTSYKLDELFWYVQHSRNKALVCKSLSNDTYHLHLLLVPKIYQSQGVGKSIMLALQSEAYTQSKNITLSSFKCNKIACSFYKSLGYTVSKEDENFITFTLKQDHL